MSGWAEGFFLAAVKRAGQALEVRLLVDRLFDADADALIVVCGDFNADVHEVPVRTIRGDEEDAGNPHLAARTLVPVERSLADSRRFSVVHHGRPQMLDHLLVSRPLLAWYRGGRDPQRGARRRTGDVARRPRQPGILPRPGGRRVRRAGGGRRLGSEVSMRQRRRSLSQGCWRLEARNAASVRLLACSLRMICRTCTFTVLSRIASS